jgi:hypothetical protein
MKRLLIFLLWIGFACHTGYSQSCPSGASDITTNPYVCGLYGDASGNPNWDWELPSTDPNYCAQWYVTGNSVPASSVQIGSPFVSATTGTIANIAQSKDYTRDKGWVLLRRDFGCSHPTSYPYFVLYNKYNGLMRIYIFQNNTVPYREMMVQITANPPSNVVTYPATTAYADAIQAAPAEYLNTNAASTIGRTIYAVTEDIGGTYRWSVVQWQTAFDPNIGNSAYNDAQLAFKIYGVITYNLQATITGTGVTSSTSGAGVTFSPATPASAGTTSTFTAGGENFTTFSKGATDLLAGVSSAATAISSALSGADPKSTEAGVKKSADSAKQTATDAGLFASIFSSVAGAVTGGSAFLKLAGALVGFFVPAKSAATPVYTSYNLTLTGTLTLQDVAQTFVLKVPGVTVQDNNNKTYYQCPLGIFNLSSAFTAETVTYQRPAQWYNGAAITWQNYHGYKITNNVGVTYYDGAGLDLVSVKAALMGRIGAQTTTGNATYDPLLKNLLETNPNSVVPVNFMHPEFTTGRLVMTAYDATAKHLHLFQTPFVDLQCFQGMSINVPDVTNVFVRVQAVLKRKDDPANTPIMYVQDYTLDLTPGTLDDNTKNTLKNSITAVPPYALFTRAPSFYEDISLVNTTYASPVLVQADNSVTAGTGVTITAFENPVVFDAGNAVYLQPGFTAGPGSLFIAHVEGFGYAPPSCTVLQTTAFAGPSACYDGSLAPQGQKSGAEASRGNTFVTAATLDSAMKIYPNPASSRVTITGLYGVGKANVVVMDATGNRIFSVYKEDDNPTLELNVEGLTSGIYFLEVRGANVTMKRKIVVAR